MTADAVATKAYSHIDRRRRRWHGEEEVRAAWISALEAALDIVFDAERARFDLSFNNVAIEFKAPGLFKGSDKSASFREAMDKRLLPYILRSAKRTGVAPEEFIGIAIDGEHLCFAQVVGGAIRHNYLLPFSVVSVGMVIEACRNNFRRPVVAESLLDDFGHASEAACAVMQALSHTLQRAIDAPEVNKISMLFEEWRALYGQVADLSGFQIETIEKVLRFTWRGAKLHSMSARLFVIHTYNSLIIKLLAAEIVSAHGLTTIAGPAEAFSALMDDSQLIDQLRLQIERGQLFETAGLAGFVEEAIFSWYIDAAGTQEDARDLIPALRALIGKLALYRTDRLGRQRDALRDFYQGLVPETLRKSLGEFYTPDWLVELTVAKIAPSAWVGPRFLDPTCGSGSFLVEVIRRKRAEAARKGLDDRATVDAVLDEVWGFDLNPLAVQTARVNFLMEIADLLSSARGRRIELPILLADAIYSPAADPEGDADVVQYRIGSRRASLDIHLPSALAFNRPRLDSVFDLMGEHVELNHEYSTMSAALVRAKLLSRAEAQAWSEPLRTTYEQVLELHKQKWNGIWFRIVRNFFWSATAGHFDAIVGNPPWVRWSRLPETYRERVKPTCERYDIFSATGHHGGNELDISAMITYTTGDKWLKMGGRMTFVITQILFQNPSSAGFRNFRIDHSSNLVPIEVEDLKALKPFPNAANKTAIALFQKGERGPSYPVPYKVWGAAEGYTQRIPPELGLDEVLERVERDTWEATPVGGTGSPWAVLPIGRFSEISQIARPCEWVEGHKGITTDLNGVYFVPIIDQNKEDRLVQIETQPGSGRKDIGVARRAWIEPDWLFPLIKGASDFEPCYLKPNLHLYTLVPNVGIKKADFDAAGGLVLGLPATRRYFNSFKDVLEQRSTWKSRMRPAKAPNFTIYNVGDYTFAPWKVIWAEMPGNFCAAVAGSGRVPLVGARPFVPDHKVFFVAFDDEMEAHYLCGMLNSTIVGQYVEAHNVDIQVGDIFKHMTLPLYEATNAAHRRIAELSHRAHSIRDLEERAAIVEEVRAAADLCLGRWIKAMARAS
ncbi:MAG: N-6 DNA methylase [Burkholderia gladioli]